MAGNVVLTCGKEKPAQGDTVKKGGGVAIVLTQGGNGRHGALEQSQHVYSWWEI